MPVEVFNYNSDSVDRHLKKISGYSYYKTSKSFHINTEVMVWFPLPENKD